MLFSLIVDCFESYGVFIKVWGRGRRGRMPLPHTRDALPIYDVCVGARCPSHVCRMPFPYMMRVSGQDAPPTYVGCPSHVCRMPVPYMIYASGQDAPPTYAGCPSHVCRMSLPNMMYALLVTIRIISSPLDRLPLKSNRWRCCIIVASIDSGQVAIDRGAGALLSYTVHRAPQIFPPRPRRRLSQFRQSPQPQELNPRPNLCDQGGPGYGL